MRLDDGDVSFEPYPFQGRQLAAVAGRWTAGTAEVTAGALDVPLGQPLARLVAHLLEPAGPDSLSAWGLFHTAYEASDAIANHRAAELARWMHAGDERLRSLYGDALWTRLPGLKAAYEQRLAADADFASDADARLAHWLEALPPQDDGLNLHPVMRTTVAPP
jgi:hypothetical protein